MYTARIPIVPLEGFTPFPGCETVFEADRAYMDRLVEHLPGPAHPIAIVTWDRDRSQKPTAETIRSLGVTARFTVLPLDEDRVLVAVEGSRAIAIQDIHQAQDGIFLGEVTPIDLRRHSAPGVVLATREQRAG